jgi:hypothetical protein
MRLAGGLAVAFACACSPCFAQQARTAAVAADSVIAFDEAVDQAGTAVPGIAVDTVISAGLGHGLEAIVRPWAQRLGSTKEWNRQIWLATLRYERGGRVGVRVDGGLIPSPVGLANMMLRAPLNPTIAMPSSLFQPLPAIEAGGPRATLLGALYPYGVSGTISTTRWDARAAVIDGSPMRARRVFAQANPPRFANVVLGGGVTPVIGLRAGGSITRGDWQNVDEVRPAGASVQTGATVVTFESEYSVRYTKLASEWVRTSRDTTNGQQAVATGWFVQGQQTLAPRWFAAARVERMSSPALAATGFVDQRFTGVESTVGYRLTPALTLRAGHRAREVFGRTAFAHTATFSIVWWQRWK